MGTRDPLGMSLVYACARHAELPVESKHDFVLDLAFA